MRRNVPDTMTKIDHATMPFHFQSRLVRCQLSYSHMQPIGWKLIRVPRSAPTSETRPPKTGIADAIMYAARETAAVKLNQVIQCLAVGWLRCFVPRRVRMKKYLATSCVMSVHCSQTAKRKRSVTYMSDQDDGGKQTRKRKPVTHLLHQNTCGSQCRRRNVRTAVVVHDDTDGDVD